MGWFDCRHCCSLATVLLAGSDVIDMWMACLVISWLCFVAAAVYGLGIGLIVYIEWKGRRDGR